MAGLGLWRAAKPIGRRARGRQAASRAGRAALGAPVRPLLPKRAGEALGPRAPGARLARVRGAGRVRSEPLPARDLATWGRGASERRAGAAAGMLLAQAGGPIGLSRAGARRPGTALGRPATLGARPGPAPIRHRWGAIPVQSFPIRGGLGRRIPRPMESGPRRTSPPGVRFRGSRPTPGSRRGLTPQPAGDRGPIFVRRRGQGAARGSYPLEAAHSARRRPRGPLPTPRAGGFAPLPDSPTTQPPIHLFPGRCPVETATPLP